MALQIKQSLKLSQQLIMTPQLQQAIKLLQMNRLELLTAINQELEINPTLEEEASEEVEAPAGNEMDLEGEAEDKLNRDHTAEVEIKEQTRDNDIDWESYFGEYNTPYQAATPTEKEERDTVSFENVVSAKTDLSDHLRWQIMLSDLSDPDKRLCLFIVGNLTTDGYLEGSLAEIAAAAKVAEAEMERILKLVQGFEPTGIAARDLRECLLLQAEDQGLKNTLTWRIIQEGLELLANKNYHALIRKFQAGLPEIMEAAEEISCLDPKPGRNYASDQAQYITPDIHVLKVGDEFVIMLNEDGLPRLKVNSFYRQALANKGQTPEKTREYIQDKLRSAVWLIRSIHQRQRTIYKVTESIVKRQRDFLEKGVAFLKPMVLKDVAEDVNMHESTISRVTTNKYVHTPQGLLELKFFFNSAIQRFHGEALASESVKERIRAIIGAEDAGKPLSDDQIKKILEADNIDIARRTVAKYRELLNILPSSKRRNPLLAKKFANRGREAETAGSDSTIEKGGRTCR